MRATVSVMIYDFTDNNVNLEDKRGFIAKRKNKKFTWEVMMSEEICKNVHNSRKLRA